jgi:hypothetical protein
MLDNVWAHWQGQNNGELANQYDMLQWSYPDEYDDNLGDQHNEGFTHNNRNPIVAGTDRNFSQDDWMVFFGPKDGYGDSYNIYLTDGPDHFGPAYFGFTQSDTRKEYWKIQDLLDMRYSFRTFQYYDRKDLGGVREPPPA